MGLKTVPAIPQSYVVSERVPLSRRAVLAFLFGEAVPFLILVAGPLRWLVPLWLSPGYPAGWQGLVPVGALAVAWSLRGRVSSTRAELKALFPSPEAPQRRGSLWLLGIGCGLLVIAQVGVSPPLWMAGTLVVIAGWVNRRHGPFVLRALAPAFGFAVLAIPAPYQVLSQAAGLTAIVTAKLAAQVLPVTGLPAKAQASVLLLGTVDMPLVVGQSWTGLFAGSATVAALACRVLMAWPGPGRAIAVIGLSLGCGMGVNFFLLCLAAHIVHASSSYPAVLSRPDWGGAFLAIPLALCISRRYLRREPAHVGAG